MESTETGSSSSMVSKKVKVIGIDLGTTYSSVGFWIGEELRIKKIPSCIAFTDYAEEPLVGEDAFDGVDENPSNTVLDVKRLIGAKFSDNRTKLDLFNSPVEVISNPVSKNDEICVIVRSRDGWKTFSPEELLCMILKKLKQIAEEEILGLQNGDVLKKLKQVAEEGLGLENGDVIFKAVISVPSCYNNAQRLATKRAAIMAGFEDSRLINETTATALAYGWLKKKMKSRQDQQQQHGVEARIPREDEENVLIFDLGGGALSVAVVNIKDGWNTYKVMSVAGDTHLGGKDFDDLLYKQHHRIPYNDPNPYLRSKSNLMRDFILSSVSVTQDVFDRECDELFDKCQEAISQCVQISGISQFHQVILVGGSTRMPRIRDMLRVFCREAQRFCEILEPDKAVVQGAALRAAIWSGKEAFSNALLKDIKIADVVPLSFRTSSLGILIPRNTMIPTIRRFRLADASSIQYKFCIAVHEGEEVIMQNNNLIGYFIFDGVQATVPKISVTCVVDYDGILNVTAAEVAEDESRRKLARRVIKTTDELNQFGRGMENPEQVEIKRKKLEAKMKVWLFVTKHMSREVPDDFSVGFSDSQEEMLRQALADAKGWLVNELPEVRDSELKLDELQRTYFLILHDDGENLREYQKKLFQQKLIEKLGYDITEDMLQPSDLVAF